MFTNPLKQRRRPRGRFLFALFFPLLILLLGYAVMWLWNGTLAQVVAVKEISYWKALGLFILCRILFGGFGFRGRNRGHFESNKFQSWRGRWQNMSEEERASLKSEWRKRCEDWRNKKT